MFNYRFTVGSITILSGLVALLCLVVGAVAVEFNFDAFADPLLALNYSHNAKLAGWFMILDMFGYYLLLLPIIFFLHQQYKYRSPWTPLFTFSGLAYVLVGSIGAAILAVTWPALMQSYLDADDQSREMILLQFKTSNLAIIKGLWNILEVLFAATWWIGIGKLLYRDKKVAGILSIATGLATLIDGIANITGLHNLAELSLNIYLLLGIVWPVMVGVVILKKSDFKMAVLQNETESVYKKAF